MVYTITLSNGQPGPVIADYSPNNATSLLLLGRGSSNYGQSIAADFIHLLENFANVTAPNAPLTGQLWFNTQLDHLQYYQNSTWHSLANLDEVNADVVYLEGLINNSGFITQNQIITLSGDISGSGRTAIVTTLPNVNVNPGSWPNITVNSKGLVTAARAFNYNDAINALTFTPVQQGTGIGQTGTSNAVKIGYEQNGRGIKATIDITDEGFFLMNAVPGNVGFRGGFAFFTTAGVDGNGNPVAQQFQVPADVTRIKITCTGAGGSGGAAINAGNGAYLSAAGGGAGGTAIQCYNVAPNQVLQIFVGIGGGSPGVSGGIAQSGFTGQTTTVVGFCHATGGQGAVWGGSVSSYGGGPGYGYPDNGGNVFQIPGGWGSNGMQPNAVGPGGDGGVSYWGGGGRGDVSGVGPTCYGAGGGGACASSVGLTGAGGAGAPGVVIIEW